MIAAVSTAALLAFSPGAPMASVAVRGPACTVNMAEAPIGRRDVLATFAAAAAAVPLAANADGASSPTVCAYRHLQPACSVPSAQAKS